MSAIIDSKNRVTPFVFGGFTIHAVSGNTGRFVRHHEPRFQLCGIGWGDGSYTRSELVEAGAIPADLDRIFDADCAAHDAFVAAL